MKTKWKVGIIGLMLIMACTSVTVYASSPPSQVDLFQIAVDIYDYLTGPVNLHLDEMESKINTLDSKLDTVSSELGMLTGKNLSRDTGTFRIVEAGVLPELARFTITVSFYQGNATDSVTVYMSQDGTYLDEVVYLNPGTGEYQTYSTTVVCKKIKIMMYNLGNDPGADKGQSTVVWAISAVGTPDSPSLTVYP
jgi:tetrahydromethanopterin S-methyltransferase subunit G